MIFIFFTALSLSLLNPPSAKASVSEIANRIASIPTKCFNITKKSWDFTIKNHSDLIGTSKDLANMYQPSLATKLATESINALSTEILGGKMAQAMFHEKLSVEDTAESVGQAIKDFAKTNGLNDLQSACMVGCSLNTLLNGREDVIWGASTELALILGTGQCKHFAYAGNMIFKKLGIEAKPVYSMVHAFFEIKDPQTGEMLTFDPMGSDQCEFFRP